MRTWLHCFLLLGAVAAFGCGQGTSSTKVTPPSEVEQIRTLLSQYAESGQLDSGVISLREQIESLKETDPAKAETLSKDLVELESKPAPAAVKTKAQEMLGKL